MNKKRDNIGYLSRCLVDNTNTKIDDNKIVIDILHIDGLIGIMPVFDTISNAKKYSNSPITIMEVNDTQRFDKIKVM